MININELNKRNLRSVGTFSRFITEQKNTHMEHVEDEIFNNGVKGTRSAINFLRDLRDMLAGHNKTSLTSTVKWDGCLHEDTIVLTNNGEMTIKEIVDRTDLYGELKVMGKELQSPLQYDHFIPLISGNVSEPSKAWVEVFMENG